MVMIKNMLLTNHNRPGKKIKKLKGIVIHWTANTDTGADAEANRNYFNTTGSYASTHYIVDSKQIIRCIPDDEIGYHVGAARYTELANSIREGNASPNYYLLGIEMCVNKDGDWNKTYEATVGLTAYLLKKHALSVDDVYRHYDITGKACPQIMLEEDSWNEFKSRVAIQLLPVRIQINGKYLAVDAFIKDDMTYAPVRAIAESLGAEVDWDETRRTVIITTK